MRSPKSPYPGHPTLTAEPRKAAPGAIFMPRTPSVSSKARIALASGRQAKRQPGVGTARRLDVAADPTQARNIWAGMSQDGMERIRRAVDAFNRRDVDALLEWNHPDIVYQTAIASMEGEGGVYHGHEGAREWLRDLDDAVEELHGELDELYDLGDGRYLGAGRFHGRGRGSGAEFDVPIAWVYIAEGDLLVRFEAYFEREKALESLGLDRWPG
jgi:ketosteroid isomerase-like protein